MGLVDLPTFTIQKHGMTIYSIKEDPLLTYLFGICAIYFDLRVHMHMYIYIHAVYVIYHNF